MDFFDLVNISERHMALINPSSPEKILRLGRYLGLTEGSRVIDYGCGFGEALILWAEAYGIRGTGIDIRPYACERARERIGGRGLADRLEIICAEAAAFEEEAATFDVAACLGATFIWEGGYRSAIQAMQGAVKPGGRLAIGEIYWRVADVPADFAREHAGILHETDLLQITREEGYEWEGVLRASADDWDRYEGDNWHGLLRWLDENPDHPDRAEVHAHFRRTQDEFVRHGRHYFGWAMYALTPTSRA